MTLIPALLLQDSGGTGVALFGTSFTFVMLAIAVVLIAGMWKVFSKAGHA